MPTINSSDSPFKLTPPPVTTYNWVPELVTQDYFQQSHVKQYEVFEIEEDLLALSCAWQRLRIVCRANHNQPHHGVTSLLNPELLKLVSQEDKTMAANIRNYYINKIMVWKLTNTHLSPYRTDLDKFLHGNGNIFRKETLGLAYRLPDFHEYDTSVDALMRDHNAKVDVNKPRLNKPITLSFQQTLVVRRKYPQTECWFTDEGDNLVKLKFEIANPLVSLFEALADRKFTIVAKSVTPKTRDNRDYLQLDKFKFI